MVLWIISAIMFAIGIALIIMYEKEIKSFGALFVGATLTSIGLALLLIGVAHASNYNEIKTKVETEYQELVMFLPQVEASDSEAVRFLFFEKVREFNEGYNAWVEYKDDWYAGWCPWYSDLYVNCERIDFKLRPGDSPTGNSEEPQEVTE